MAIDALIFSKDRACQLDLLLRSIERHAPELYSSVTVLWTASQREYGRGYAQCFAEHARAKFISESHFEHQVRHWLRLSGDTVSFLVDDDVFYRDADWDGTVPWSFRGGDYDYPFSVDGNVYSRVDVAVVLYRVAFRSPTELEARAHDRRHLLPFTELPHGEPCLVGVPLNRVSATSGMPHLGVHEYDLNERYLEGARLELPVVDGPLAAHAALRLRFPVKTRA